MQFDGSTEVTDRSLYSPAAIAAQCARRWRATPVLRAIVGLVVLGVAGCASAPEDQLAEVRKLQANNQMEESIPILIELIEAGNRGGEILYRYGRALSLSGKPERSVWALDAARDDPEWFVRASQQLAVDAQLAGNYDFAIEIFKRLHEEAPDEIDDDIFGLLLETRVLLDSQTHYEEALELVESVIERFPEEDTAIRLKAAALLGLKRPDEAYEILRSAGMDPKQKKDAAAKSGGDGSKTKGNADESTSTDLLAAQEGESAESGDEEDDPELFADVEDDVREAFWCTVRVSFKREAGEVDEATRILEECLERFPASSELLTEAAKLYSGLGRFDRILAVLEKANEESPENREIRDALLQILARAGRFKDAETILRKTIAAAEAEGRGSATETASLWVDLAGFLMERDRVGEALVAFDKVNQIIGDSASPDLLLRQAEALIRAKEYDEALAMADKTPVPVHATMLRGRVAFERGEYRKALDLLGEATLEWPDNAPIRYYRARAAEGVGDFDLAVEEYRHAIRSDPKLAAARERLARLHLAEGNFREASFILTFQSPRDPSDPSVEMRILMVEVDARRGTEPDLEILPDAKHTSPQIRSGAIRALSRGIAERASPKVAEAVLAEFQKESVPEIRGAFLRERVRLLASYGEEKSAIAEARKLLAARPDDLDVQVALGHALSRQETGREEAARILASVSEKSPQDVDVRILRGEIAASGGARDSANRHFEAAASIAPDRWDAVAPLVDQLRAAGKTDAAIERLEQFVDRDGPYEGRAALELAKMIPATEQTRERRLALARRSIRFGVGEEAIEFIAALDPAAAAEYEIISSAKPGKGSRAAKKLPGATRAAAKAVQPPADAQVEMPVPKHDAKDEANRKG